MQKFELFEARKHYEEIKKWWEAQEWSVMPLTHLPKTGIVVYSNDVMACAAWIYKTDSAICILDFIVASPIVRKQERADALTLLVSSAKNLAKELGFTAMFTFTRHSSLISRLEKQGFEVSCDGMSNLIINLNSRSL